MLTSLQLKILLETSKMTQEVGVSVTKPEELCLTPGTHGMERKQTPRVGLELHVHHDTHMPSPCT